jgi:hypothetical protein
MVNVVRRYFFCFVISECPVMHRYIMLRAGIVRGGDRLLANCFLLGVEIPPPLPILVNKLTYLHSIWSK